MKIKKADIIMLLIIAVILLSGVGVAFKFYNGTNETVPGGTSVVTEQAGEGLLCSLEIRCDTILSNLDQLVPSKGEYVPENGMILQKTNINFKEGESVFQILKRVCNDTGIQLEYSWTPLYDSYYIEGINHLYEFDFGSSSGWMYLVNDNLPNYGSSSYIVEAGDEIVWYYTCQGMESNIGGE